MTGPLRGHPHPTHPHLNVGGRVLAAVDSSPDYADSITRHAAWAARRLDAPLEYLHVLDRHPETAATADLSGNLELGARNTLLHDLTAIDEARSKLAQERGRLLLQQARTIASSHGVAAETCLRHGGLVDNLTALEADVRLFVLGKRGEHADFAEGHLGSQLERVVRAVHRPLLVTSREYIQVQRVLIAFDGSTTTRNGVEMVAASPLFRGLDIRVVMVATETEPNLVALRWAVDTLAAAGLTAEGRVQPGEPEDITSHYARDENADLLVMGAYGHARIRRLIVGSMTTALLRTCRIPVLLLR